MYKITSLRSSLFSLNDAKVKYKVGKFVTAPEWLAKKGFHLIVFDNFENAINYLEESTEWWYPYYPGVEIWRCEVKKEVPLPFVCNLGALRIGKITPTSLKWPKGTKMFEKVKLMELAIYWY